MTHAVALRRASWRHPEAGAAIVAAGAWGAVLLTALGGATAAAHAAVHDAQPLLAAALGWSVMAAAMMIPGALGVAGSLALAALWERRQRTIALFITSYLTVWLGFGVVVLGAWGLAGIDPAPLLPALLLAAAAWELTPWKWRAVRSCRLMTPLPPRGARADAASLRAGLIYGRRCAAACAPLMLAMAAAGHGDVGLMMLLSAVVTAEKAAARPSRLAAPAAALLVFAAATTIVVG